MTKVTPRLPRDSVLAYIPLNVTADLGVAMRRVRSKRIARLESLYPSLSESNTRAGTCNGTADDSGAEVSRSGDESDNDDDASQQQRKTKKKMIKTSPHIPQRIPQRDQFGSVLDYLEAKYVKGVMIEDLDERIRERQKKKKRKKRESENGTTASGNDCVSSNENDNSVLSDSAAGSCYSSGSGSFIDDAALQSEVAGQVQASSAYGTTRIEAEAALDRKGGSEKGGESGDDDDHAFFVNVGDLEMEEGFVDYDEDDAREWMDMVGKGKGKKRKRVPKENPLSPKETNKPKTPSKKQKTANESDKQKKQSKPSSKSSQSQSSSSNKDSDSTSTKTTQIEKPKKKMKIEKAKETEKVKVKDKSKSKEKTKAKESVKDKAKDKDTESTTSSAEHSSNIAMKKEKKEKKEEQEAKTLQMTLIDVARKESADLKVISDRLYKKCVIQIKKMTDEHLPRKPKSVGKTKVSITVPAHKKGGDKITFSNPHFPSQKLKVQIPDSCKPGKSFKVSVPMPKVSKAPVNAQNKFTKEATEILDEYSRAYDEWCQAEAKFRALKPKKKNGKIIHFKAGVERLKKYDEMLDEFPKNLLVPIDAVFIRKLVRRTRQNANKRMKALAVAAKMEAASAAAALAKKQSESTPEKKVQVPVATMKLEIPGMGTSFPSVPFKEADFERTDP